MGCVRAGYLLRLCMLSPVDQTIAWYENDRQDPVYCRFLIEECRLTARPLHQHIYACGALSLRIRLTLLATILKQRHDT
jgi:hypothetical protein